MKAYILIIERDGEASYPRFFLTIQAMLTHLREDYAEGDGDPEFFKKDLPTLEYVEMKLNENPVAVIGVGTEDVLNISPVPQEAIQLITQPILNSLQELRDNIQDMIGHPENPFAENILESLVEDADRHLNKKA